MKSPAPQRRASSIPGTREQGHMHTVPLGGRLLRQPLRACVKGGQTTLDFCWETYLVETGEVVSSSRPAGTSPRPAAPKSTSWEDQTLTITVGKYSSKIHTLGPHLSWLPAPRQASLPSPEPARPQHSCVLQQQETNPSGLSWYLQVSQARER